MYDSSFNCIEIKYDNGNMNVQAHMSGQQRSGQSPNQGNNGNSQMQNLAGAGGSVGPSRSTVGPMDHDVLKLRQYMQVLV